MTQVDSKEFAIEDELRRLRQRVRELEASDKELRERLQRGKVLLANLPHRLFFKDKESRYLYVNDAFAAELGKTAEEVIGKTDFDFFPRELAENYRADDQWVLRHRRPVVTVVHMGSPPADSYVEVTKAATFDESGKANGVIGYFVDVTERRRAEEALEHERFLLLSLMDTIPDNIYFKDAACRFLRINKALADKFGLRTPTEAIGKTDFDFFDKEHAQQAFADEQKVLATGRPMVSREECEVMPDGRRAWILSTKMPLRDRDGRITGTFGVSRDISERKATEEELLRQKSILELVLNSIADGVVMADLDGRLTLTNPAAKQILGVPDDVYQSTLAQWSANFGLYLSDKTTPFPPDQTPLARALRGEAVDGAEIFVRHAARPQGIWLGVDARPVRNLDGTLQGGVAAFRDVTQRKVADEALLASEERYRELFENAKDVVYTHDLQGVLTSFNKEAERVTGYTREELLGQSIASLVAADHVPLAMKMMQKKLTGQETTTYELDIISKQGRRIPVEVSTRIVFQGAVPMGVQGIARDVTERRRAAEALQKQARLLGDQAVELEKRHSELSQAYGELKEAETQLVQSEKMAAIGQLVAGLAHEINNPAAFVMTNLTVIDRDLEDLLAYMQQARKLEELAKPLDPLLVEKIVRLREERGVDEAFAEIPAMVDSAKRGMIRIRDLVANLRAYSRIDVRGEYVMADLQEGLRATMLIVRPIVPKEVVLELTDAELPMVECNFGQVNQVFMNLLINAVQAVGDCGRVSAAAERDGQGVLVRIRDTGPGVPKEIRSRIFDPFFTTKEVGKGTGLGLSISRRIIESHHGRIELSSEPGAGAEFRVWLPLVQPKSDTPADSPAESE